ncbi:hypothetical protein Agub_g3353, partial [Astrephomene gubernaculifera]
MTADTAPALPDEVLAAFCPVLFLHHDDAYLPVPVEWFIERAQLNYYPQGITGTAELLELDQVPGGVITLIAAGSVSQENLLDIQSKTALPGNLSLTVAPEHYGGCPAESLSDVPIYVHTKLVVDEYGAPEAYELNYATFYAFNGHYDLPGGLPLFRAGHHVGDWEHLTVRLHAASLQLQGVWYNAHRNIEGEWVPAAQVPRTPCGRIVGHVAINGHGIYPHCGTIPRLFLVANDRTSRRGPVWSPRRLLRLAGLTHGSSCPLVLSRGCSLPHLAPHPGPTSTSQPGGSPTGGSPRSQAPAGQGATFADHPDELASSDGVHRLLPPPPTHGSSSNKSSSVVPPRNATAAAAARAASEAAAQAAGAARAAAGAASRLGRCMAAAAAKGGVLTWRRRAAAEVRSAPETEGSGMGAAATVAADAGSSVVVTTVAGAQHPLAAAAGGAAGGAAGSCYPLPQVVHDTSLWQRYQGRWGSIPTLTQQCWFTGPEPPVSRGLLRRLCMPWAPGVERLTRQQQPPKQQQTQRQRQQLLQPDKKNGGSKGGPLGGAAAAAATQVEVTAAAAATEAPVVAAAAAVADVV